MFLKESESKSHSVMSNSLRTWAIQFMEFSRPEYWSEQPFPSLEDIPNPSDIFLWYNSDSCCVNIFLVLIIQLMLFNYRKKNYTLNFIIANDYFESKLKCTIQTVFIIFAIEIFNMSLKLRFYIFILFSAIQNIKHTYYKIYFLNEDSLMFRFPQQ